jgi:tetratricopeptide (TPR) repeat protein
MAPRTLRASRPTVVTAAAALLAGTPAILAAVWVRNPWILAGAASAAAVIAVFGAVRHLRHQRRDEQELRVEDGFLVVPGGRLPSVRDITDPVALGVHPAESGAPAYVPRDIDSELREGLAAGEFVMLVGDSAVGKSRAAFEAVSATLAGHVLICPVGRDAVAAAVGRAAEEPRCVLWLDDLERYLGPGGLTAEQAGRLLSGDGQHRAIVATIRAAELARIDEAGDGAGRQFSRDARQVLDQAHPIRVARMFTGGELGRASARDWDPGIADAIRHAASHGIAECLAAGPGLLREWEDGRASSEYPDGRGAALVAAAVDIRRAGYTSPVPRALIDQVHGHYLAHAEHPHPARKAASDAWAWATRPRRGASSLLRPSGPGLIGVFDYLVDAVQRSAGHVGQVPEQVVRAAIDAASFADLDSMAAAAYIEGHYTLAEHAWRRAYQAKTSDGRLGPEHPDTLASRNDLAGVLRDLGRLEEAEAEHRAVLETRTRVLGAEHPDTLASRNDLAGVLRDRGRLEEAEAEHRAEFETRSRVLGLDHPATLASRGNLAAVLRARGRLGEAEAEYRAILETISRVLGGDHPAALTGRSSLALVLYARGRLDEAEAEHRAVLEGRTRVLGTDHPDSLASRGNLASVLYAQGRLEEAEAEHRAIVETMTRVLGADHPGTLASRGSLAGVLYARGRLGEAENEQRAVLEGRTRLLGADHPGTLASRGSLAGVLYARGRLEEAEAGYRAVLHGRARVLGLDHPDTLASRGNLASVLRALGRLDEAEQAALPPETVS